MVVFLVYIEANGIPERFSLTSLNHIGVEKAISVIVTALRIGAVPTG